MPRACTAIVVYDRANDMLDLSESPELSGLQAASARAYDEAQALIARMLWAYARGHQGRPHECASQLEQLEWMRGAVDAADGVTL
jgi:hypothetical protein